MDCYKYDPDVIGPADVEWANQTQVLGYNPSAAENSKFYVSGPVRVQRFLNLSSETRQDPILEGIDVRSLKVYKNEKCRERVIPFHPECYKTLAWYLTGGPDPTKINKGALYRAFDQFSVVRKIRPPELRCLSLDYGDVNEASSWYWICIPGREYTVSNPQYSTEVKDKIASLISGSEFKSQALQFCYEAKSVSNPLRALPETALFIISEFLDNTSLLNLSCASWTTFLSLRDNASFWKRRIVTHLPYFAELHECLREQSQALKGRDYRKIFQWAEYASKPRSGVAKLMLSIANRRRIWKVCEQIESLYIREPRCPPTEKGYVVYQAVKSGLQVLGDTREPGLYFSSASFLRGWHELLRPWTFDLFWNSEGDLSAIAISFGEDQRIFGHEPQERGSYQTTGSFPGGVWIKCFVFHIYASSILRPWQACSWNYSSCRGVTVYLTDGSEHTYGQDDPHLFKLPFAVAENMTIIGIKGTLTAHKRYGVDPFIEKMWLLQARTDGGEKPSEVPEARPHEGSCWAGNTYMFKSLLAPDSDMRLQMLKGRIRDDDGSIWPEQRWDTFEIDGQGGERIEEIKVYHGPYHDPAPTAIEIHTNWGRSVLWGVDMKRDKNGGETNEHARLPIKRPTHLRPDDGFAIVGLVMGCGKVFGRWHSDNEIIDPLWDRKELMIGKDYMDEEDVRGPWTKEQYEKRNDSTLHTGMSKFGIITKRITDGPELGI
ncbi:activator of stress 1 [Fusarium subglutinans]|uniref:Activator of stress 1 n=1 Tax=Gibberella subglutinans TaxID=42677 RepID=A0A8H5PU02_GIBSU|nr:activator of stress 1 [Fusarium subglutinans]KAF5602844.1 activator of stress 1 [Fusarium subglutinans]